MERITLSLQDDKFDLSYWNDMVDDGERFTSAKTMIWYLLVIGVIVQLISFLFEPTTTLIWYALGFVIATNVGAVVLAVKAQFSAEGIGKKTSLAFNADFYHTIHLMTEMKKKFVEEAEKDGNSLKQEVDNMGEDIYSVMKGYLRTYNQHMNSEIEMVESKDIQYDKEEDLFTQ
jgi:hypothetical protein